MFGNERFLKFREADTGGVTISKIVQKIDYLNPKVSPEQVVEEIAPQEKKQQIEIVEVVATAQQTQEEKVEVKSQDEQAQTSDGLKVQGQKTGNVVKDIGLGAVEKKDLNNSEQEGNQAEAENVTVPVQQTIPTPTTNIHATNNQNLNHGNAADAKTQVAPPLPPRRNLKADAMNEAKKNMSDQQASVSAKMNGGQAATHSLSQSFTLPKLPFPSWVRNGVAKMMDKHPSTGSFLRNAFNSVVEAIKQKASGILRWVYRKEIEQMQRYSKILVHKGDLDSPRNELPSVDFKKFYLSDIKRGLLERSSKESDKNLLQKMKDFFGSVDQLVDESKQKIESLKDRPSSFSAK